MNNVMIGSIGALSLKQYVSQDVPSRDARVKLLKSQVVIGKYDKMGLRSIKIKKFPYYSYVQVKGDYALYTQDRSGDPSRQTNFLLDHK
jgi:hypothetical protein